MRRAAGAAHAATIVRKRRKEARRRKRIERRQRQEEADLRFIAQAVRAPRLTPDEWRDFRHRDPSAFRQALRHAKRLDPGERDVVELRGLAGAVVMVGVSR